MHVFHCDGEMCTNLTVYCQACNTHESDDLPTIYTFLDRFPPFWGRLRGSVFPRYTHIPKWPICKKRVRFVRRNKPPQGELRRRDSELLRCQAQLQQREMTCMNLLSAFEAEDKWCSSMLMAWCQGRMEEANWIKISDNGGSSYFRIDRVGWMSKSGCLRRGQLRWRLFIWGKGFP